MKLLFDKIKKYGVNGMINYIFQNLLKTYWHNVHYLKTTINNDEVSDKLNEFNIKFKKLDFNDFLLGDSDEFTESKLQLIKKRLDDSSLISFGLIDDNILAYSTWISLKKIELPLISNEYLLNENEGFLKDSYCHPNYRGRGLHSCFNLYRLSQLYKLGKKECIVFVFKQNRAALKVQKKCGFIDLGCFKVGEIFGIPFTSFKKNKFV